MGIMDRPVVWLLLRYVLGETLRHTKTLNVFFEYLPRKRRQNRISQGGRANKNNQEKPVQCNAFTIVAITFARCTFPFIGYKESKVGIGFSHTITGNAYN